MEKTQWIFMNGLRAVKQSDWIFKFSLRYVCKRFLKFKFQQNECIVGKPIALFLYLTSSVFLRIPNHVFSQSSSKFRRLSNNIDESVLFDSLWLVYVARELRIQYFVSIRSNKIKLQISLEFKTRTTTSDHKQTGHINGYIFTIK